MPYSEKFIKKINTQAHRGFKSMAPFRKVRTRMWTNFTGSHYGAARRVKRPLNLIYQIATILLPNLVSGRQKVRVHTENLQLKQMAELEELAVQFKMDQMMFSNTMRLAVLEALMGGLAIAKTAIMPQGEPAGLRSYLHRAGQSYTDLVSLDDFVPDIDATSLEDMFFVGNRYKMPQKFVKESGFYDDKAFAQLQRHHEAESQDASRRTEELSRSRELSARQDDFLEYVEMIDLWIPIDNIVLTLPWNTGATVALRTVEWEGPATGPYDFMSFNQVGDNFMPVSPLSQVADVDEAANEAMHKLIKRVANLKHILGYTAQAADDAQNVVDSSDLEAILMDHPDLMKEFTFNGPEQIQYHHIAFLQEWASKLSGNTELVGGMGAQAGTLGQEQILVGNASIRTTDMRDKVDRFGARIAAKHGWFMHYDPYVQIPLVRRPAPGVEIPTVYSAATREGDWHDFNFKYEAYSEVAMDPQVRAGRQMQWATEVVPAAIGLQMQTGGAFPALKFMRFVGKLMGVEGLDEFTPDEEALQTAAIAAMAYQHEGKGQPQMPGMNPTGHTQFKMAPQLAGGARDSATVNNGRFSAASQAGAMTPTGGR